MRSPSETSNGQRGLPVSTQLRAYHQTPTARVVETNAAAIPRRRRRRALLPDPGVDEVRYHERREDDRDHDAARLRAEHEPGRDAGEQGRCKRRDPFLAPREAEARRVEEADDEVEGGEEERGDGDVVVGRVRLREDDRRDRDERAGGHGRPGRQPDPPPEAGDRERGEHGERDLRRVDEEVVVHEERGPCEERLDTRRVVAAARDVVVRLDAAALHPVRDDRQVVDDRVEAERRQHDREQRAPGEREAREDDERPLPPREDRAACGPRRRGRPALRPTRRRGRGPRATPPPPRRRRRAGSPSARTSAGPRRCRSSAAWPPRRPGRRPRAASRSRAGAGARSRRARHRLRGRPARAGAAPRRSCRTPRARRANRARGEEACRRQRGPRSVERARSAPRARGGSPSASTSPAAA